MHTEAELRGRLLATETLIVVLMTRIALISDDPKTFNRQIMDCTEQLLKGIAAKAPTDMEGAAFFALSSFRDLSEHMMTYLALDISKRRA